MGKGEGKGEGKGGCFEDICGAIREGIACLCCLLLAGPILIIVGIVFLVDSGNNERGKTISEFNKLTADWNEFGYKDFSTNTSFAVQFSFSDSFLNEECPQQGQIEGGPFLLQGSASPADHIGADSKRVSFQQWKYRLHLPEQVQYSQGLTKNCTMTIEFLRLSPDGIEQTSEGPATPIGSTSAAPITFTQSGPCSSSSSSSSSTCRQKCESKGGTYDYPTKMCNTTSTLSDVCIKVDESGEGVRDWTENDQLPGQGTGCFWNMWDQTFDQTQTKDNGNVNQLQIYVRSARDPYLNFQYVTDGTETFGLSTEQKIIIGISCLVVGALFISFWVLTIYCCCLYCGCCGERPQAARSGPIGGIYHSAFNRYGRYIPGYTPYPQTQPYQQQPPAYTPPQMDQYGQPIQYQEGVQPPVYTQPPPPQYGQPGYVGQQPPYGGQPTPYGAPPPGGYPGAQGGQPTPYGAPPPTGYQGPQEGQYKYT